MKKTYAIANLISVILVVVVNGLSQSQRWNNTTIGERSDQYDNLFTPAGYAFAIWGLIFLMLVGYALFQIRRAFFSDKTTPSIEQTGWWFFIANLANAAWVVAFTYDYIGVSQLIMLVILVSLLMIVKRTSMERWDAPIEVIAFVWWPICIYAGWIAVATIANFSAYFTALGFDGGPWSETTWTLLMIVIATAVNLFMIFSRNMREFAAVGIWALVAIYVRHGGRIDTIAYTALAGALILGIAAMYHGYQNRATAPHLKLKERLSKS